MEKLYNNVILEDNFADNPSDADNVPYLKKPPKVIDVTVGRQLFVDDFLIESTNLTAEHHKATKFEHNPVLRPEKPWETVGGPCACPKSGGVWYDEQDKVFKTWYEASWCRHNAYAISEDGINWKRPNLGIVDGTNIIMPYEYQAEKFTGDLTYLRPDSSAVIIDYKHPEQKYKLFLRNPGGLDHAIVATSKDGINFENFQYTTAKMGDRSTVFYNPFRKKWVYSVRMSVSADDDWVRFRQYRECDDFLVGASWTDKDCKKWLDTDEKDLPNPYLEDKPQLYNVDCVGYESIMLGMFQIHYGPKNQVGEQSGVPKITELMPMYSRDGYHFSRPSRDTIIKSSIKKGTWDRGYVQSVGGGVIVLKDELRIYYIAFAGDENHGGEDFSTNGMYRNGAMGFVSLRRDGFVSMNGKGNIITRKLTMNNKKTLHINAQGKVCVSVLDENKNVLVYSKEFNGDSTNFKLEFENFDISTLNGKVFRLKFDVDGKLYSFGFADDKGDFGGARAAGFVE